jgi:hypothetical protein
MRAGNRRLKDQYKGLVNPVLPKGAILRPLIPQPGCIYNA